MECCRFPTSPCLPPCPAHAAQRALQDALAQQRDAQLARDSEAAARAAAASKHPVALDAARRAEAGLRERLRMAERQVERQDGEVRALREANEKLDLALAALRVGLDRAIVLWWARARERHRAAVAGH